MKAKKLLATVLSGIMAVSPITSAMMPNGNNNPSAIKLNQKQNQGNIPQTLDELIQKLKEENWFLSNRSPYLLDDILEPFDDEQKHIILSFLQAYTAIDTVSDLILSDEIPKKMQYLKHNFNVFRTDSVGVLSNFIAYQDDPYELIAYMYLISRSNSYYKGTRQKIQNQMIGYVDEAIWSWSYAINRANQDIKPSDYNNWVHLKKTITSILQNRKSIFANCDTNHLNGKPISNDLKNLITNFYEQNEEFFQSITEDGSFHYYTPNPNTNPPQESSMPIGIIAPTGIDQFNELCLKHPNFLRGEYICKYVNQNYFTRPTSFQCKALVPKCGFSGSFSLQGLVDTIKDGIKNDLRLTNIREYLSDFYGKILHNSTSPRFIKHYCWFTSFDEDKNTGGYFADFLITCTLIDILEDELSELKEKGIEVDWKNVRCTNSLEKYIKTNDKLSSLSPKEQNNIKQRLIMLYNTIHYLFPHIDEYSQEDTLSVMDSHIIHNVLFMLIISNSTCDLFDRTKDRTNARHFIAPLLKFEWEVAELDCNIRHGINILNEIIENVFNTSFFQVGGNGAGECTDKLTLTMPLFYKLCLEDVLLSQTLPMDLLDKNNADRHIIISKIIDQMKNK